jgi:hypothetical protein
MKKINSIDMGSKGYYKLTVLDAAGNIKPEKSTGIIDNVVTYGGAYDSLINIFGGIFASYTCQVGTGTVERTRSSTGLGNVVAGTSNLVSASRAGNEVDNLDGTSTLTLSRTFSFTLGSKVGTFSEVGVFDGAVFIAGQLIKDEVNAPTTVTILADEQLVVTYTIEWTVPNVSVLMGTGTVTDALGGTYDYEVYAQPYFAEFANIGGADQEIRWSNANSIADEIGFYAADGTTSLYDSNDLGSGFSGLFSHNGTGVATVTSPTISISPSGGSWTNLVFITLYGVGSAEAARNGVANTTTVTGASANIHRLPIIIKFVDPVTKTSNDTFAFAVTASVNL